VADHRLQGRRRAALREFSTLSAANHRSRGIAGFDFLPGFIRFSGRKARLRGSAGGGAGRGLESGG
jgi:hypothetical protein